MYFEQSIDEMCLWQGSGVVSNTAFWWENWETCTRKTEKEMDIGELGLRIGGGCNCLRMVAGFELSGSPNTVLFIGH
jgi:hypothetical protein